MRWSNLDCDVKKTQLAMFILASEFRQKGEYIPQTELNGKRISFAQNTLSPQYVFLFFFNTNTAMMPVAKTKRF